VRGVLGLPSLHPLADGIGDCTCNVFHPGDEQGWHYDESEFSVTLMLSSAEEGGEFQYIPHCRSPPDGGQSGEREEEYGRIGVALNSNKDDDLSPVGGLRNLPLAPGSLAIFKGRTALHRVTVVGGLQTRLVAVLTYNQDPGISNSEDVRELFWGRRHPLVSVEVP